MIELLNFDLDISSKVQKLIQLAKDEGLDYRNFYIEVVFWQDTDYRIELTSSWGDYQDVFSYVKSTDKYTYYKRSQKGSDITESIIEGT